MDNLSANEAKTQFGNLLLRVQRGPVGISKNGKPTAVMVSSEEYHSIELLRQQFLQARARQARDAIASGNLVDGEAFFDDLEAGHLD
ncbi:MAG: type II toxin-antitoxin system Phd/YefM family antitoxin [Marinobacter sp.]|uniref:type II toxin-antitoxin system Phd/YefM family antitoxin n=1 Tax=Marinobacter sp. TaxID=50741 RepID=UPI0034A0176E